MGSLVNEENESAAVEALDQTLAKLSEGAQTMDHWDLTAMLKHLQHKRDFETARRVQLFRNVNHLLKQAIASMEGGN